MFDDHLVRKEALQDYKNMILVKNWNFPLCLFLDKMGLEIMFDGHPVQKQPMIRLD